MEPCALRDPLHRCAWSVCSVAPALQMDATMWPIPMKIGPRRGCTALLRLRCNAGEPFAEGFRHCALEATNAAPLTVACAASGDCAGGGNSLSTEPHFPPLQGARYPLASASTVGRDTVPNLSVSSDCSVRHACTYSIFRAVAGTARPAATPDPSPLRPPMKRATEEAAGPDHPADSSAAEGITMATCRVHAVCMPCADTCV